MTSLISIYESDKVAVEEQERFIDRLMDASVPTREFLRKAAAGARRVQQHHPQYRPGSPPPLKI